MKTMDKRILNLYLQKKKDNMIKKYFLLIVAFVFLASCKTQKADDYNYLKDIEKVALENSIKNNRNTIQPGDQLVILVSAKDMDVAAPFNKSYSSTTNITQYSSPSSNSQPQALPVTGPLIQLIIVIILCFQNWVLSVRTI
jgi:polysaccharide export outer membrane protein